jgi:hypothetical protein
MNMNVFLLINYCIVFILRRLTVIINLEPNKQKETGKGRNL